MTEDLEQFRRKGDATPNECDHHNGPGRGEVGRQAAMQKIAEHHEPDNITNDVLEYAGGERKILKGNPTNDVPVWMSYEITQWQDGSKRNDKKATPDQNCRRLQT